MYFWEQRTGLGSGLVEASWAHTASALCWCGEVRRGGDLSTSLQRLSNGPVPSAEGSSKQQCSRAEGGEGRGRSSSSERAESWSRSWSWQQGARLASQVGVCSDEDCAQRSRERARARTGARARGRSGIPRGRRSIRAWLLYRCSVAGRGDWRRTMPFGTDSSADWVGQQGRVGFARWSCRGVSGRVVRLEVDATTLGRMLRVPDSCSAHPIPEGRKRAGPPA